MQEKSNKEEVLVVDDNPLVGVNELTPKHFDYLQVMLHKMNQYHYRHITEVSWKRLAFWFSCVLVIEIFESLYISGVSSGEIGKSLLLSNIGRLFACGAICVVSKCLIRLYHFKHIAVRLLQSLFIFQLVDIISPFFLILNNIHPYFEFMDAFLEVSLILGLIYYIGYSFVPYKSLEKVTRVYLGLAFLFVLTLMQLDSFSHYVFKDNELTVYSDFEGANARDLASIDSLIEEVVRK